MKHYAGDVTYASVGFREKNKDTLHPDLSGVMRESQSDFVRTLFPDEPPSSGDGAAATRLADVEGQANKAASLVFAGQAEVQRLKAEVETLKRSLSAASASVAELSRSAAKPPSNASLSAETQARLNKALKQSEAAQASCTLLKEELASHRDEMQSVTSTLARGLKESRSAAAGGRARVRALGRSPLSPQPPRR